MRDFSGLRPPMIRAFKWWHAGKAGGIGGVSGLHWLRDKVSPAFFFFVCIHLINSKYVLIMQVHLGGLIQIFVKQTQGFSLKLFGVLTFKITLNSLHTSPTLSRFHLQINPRQLETLRTRKCYF